MRLARRVGPGDHLSDLNKTLARHKIGNTKWLARATHSDTHRNFPGAVKLSLDIGQCGPGTGPGRHEPSSQTEDAETRETRASSELTILSVTPGECLNRGLIEV